MHVMAGILWPLFLISSDAWDMQTWPELSNQDFSNQMIHSSLRLFEYYTAKFKHWLNSAWFPQQELTKRHGPRQESWKQRETSKQSVVGMLSFTQPKQGYFFFEAMLNVAYMMFWVFQRQKSDQVLGTSKASGQSILCWRCTALPTVSLRLTALPKAKIKGIKQPSRKFIGASPFISAYLTWLQLFPSYSSVLGYCHVNDR